MTRIDEIAQIESDMELCRAAGVTKVPIPMDLLARLIDALKRSLTR